MRQALLYSNAFVALAAASLTAATAPLLRDGASPRLDASVGLACFGTLAVYAADRLLDKPTGRSDRPRWIARHRRALALLGGVALLLALGFALSLSRRTYPAMAVAGLVTAGYILPILPGRRRLKDLFAAKAFLVALAWALITAAVPALDLGASHEDALRLSIERFLFVLAAAIPFDVRDMKRDKADRIRTLPLILGLPLTKLTILLALLGFAGLVLQHPYPLEARLALLIPAGLLAGLTARLNPRQTETYYLLYVDGTMLLQGAAVCAIAWL